MWTLFLEHGGFTVNSDSVKKVTSMLTLVREGSQSSRFRANCYLLILAVGTGAKSCKTYKLNTQILLLIDAAKAG